MGEDPYLSATMVVPYIKGVQENGVAACVKHYALNNQEFNRHTTNVQLVIVLFMRYTCLLLKQLFRKVEHGRLWALIIFIRDSTPVTTSACFEIFFVMNGVLMAL